MSETEKLKHLCKFLAEQQKKIEALIDEGPEEHSPEMYFNETDNTTEIKS